MLMQIFWKMFIKLYFEMTKRNVHEIETFIMGAIII